MGGERTFDHDISSGPALRDTLERIIDIVWDRIERSGARGRTVTLKLKFADFRPMSRARSVARPVEDKQDFARLSRELLDAVLPLPQPVRLMGLTLSALEGDEEEDEETAAGGEPIQGKLPF